MNILWKQPTGVLAFTSVFNEVDIETYVTELKNRGDIPADWELLGFDIEWSIDERWKHETYRYLNGNIIVDNQEALEETKERLRGLRAPLLQQLDIEYIKALEMNLDTLVIVQEKQRLRDITNNLENLSLDALAEKGIL